MLGKIKIILLINSLFFSLSFSQSWALIVLSPLVPTNQGQIAQTSAPTKISQPLRHRKLTPDEKRKFAKILKQKGYLKKHIPTLIEDIEQILNRASLRLSKFTGKPFSIDDFKAVKDDPQQLANRLALFGKGLAMDRDSIIFDYSNIAKLVKNFVAYVNDEDVMKLVEQSTLSIEKKRDSRVALTDCAAISSVVEILLEFSGIEVKAGLCLNHAFIIVPINQTKFIWVDLSEVRGDAVTIIKTTKCYYRTGGYMAVRTPCLKQPELYRSSVRRANDCALIFICNMAVTRYLNHALIYRDLEMAKKSTQFLNKFKQIEPNYWQVYEFLGNNYYKTGNYQAAAYAYEKSFTVVPSDLGILTAREEIFYECAVANYRWGRYRHLLELMNKWPKEFTAGSEGSAIRLAAHYRLGDISQARQLLGAVTAPCSTTLEILVELGQDRQRSGDQSGAIKLFSLVRKFEPKNLGALIGLAESYYASGDYGQAAIAGQQAIRLDPKNPELGLLLGRSYVQSGQHARAIPLLEKAKDLIPSSIDIRTRLGIAYYLTGKESQAKHELEKACTPDSTHPEAKKYLSQVYLKKARALQRMDKDKAGYYFDKADELGVKLKGSEEQLLKKWRKTKKQVKKKGRSHDWKPATQRLVGKAVKRWGEFKQDPRKKGRWFLNSLLIIL